MNSFRMLVDFGFLKSAGAPLASVIAACVAIISASAVFASRELKGKGKK